MGEHPYRTSAEPKVERKRTTLEDHVVDLVLLAVGILGVVIGIIYPHRAVELTAGIFLVVFVVRDGNWRWRR